MLHSLKGQAWLHSLRNQMGHNVVTGRDCFRYRLAFLNQILGVVQPHVRTMGIAGYADNLAEFLRLYVLNHLADESGAAFRNTKGANVAANLLRSYA